MRSRDDDATRNGHDDVPADVDPPAEPEEESYTLAELAAAGGVTERTIRYYQSEKLIPKPTKRGRDRLYHPSHLRRIELIADLRDRGLSLGTIRELVDTEDPARTVASWLGLDATLSVPWSDDRPLTVSLDQLRDLVTDRSPGLLAELNDAGYTRANPDGTWTVPSPALLGFALELRRAGIDVEVAGHIRDLLRRRLSKAVDEVVEYIVDRAGSGFAGGAGPDELSAALAVLRPVARETTSLIVAQEFERALADLVATRPRRLTRSSDG